MYEHLEDGGEPPERISILYEVKVSSLHRNEYLEDSVKREMSDSGINVHEFIKKNLLLIYQIPNLAASPIPQITLEILAQITLHPWTKENQPERVVLRCIFQTDTEEQIRSNLKWEHDYRYRDLKGLRGTMICTYPIIPTISDSGDYGRWMNDLLEIYDGVIFARKFWKGVAFSLD